MFVQRKIQSKIKSDFFKGKAIIVFGPRQSGKTTLIESILSEVKQDVLYMNGDEPDTREMLTNVTSTKLKQFIGKKKYVFIDESQKIKDAGTTLKLITDQIKEVQLIASGSSSFDLFSKIQEPLTGRKFEYLLLPFSFSEMVEHNGLIEEKRTIEHRMIFGYYPEIVMKQDIEKKLLISLTSSYLYKDILTLEGINKPYILDKLLKALAFQLGNEVSLNEISQITDTNIKTIEKYIDLMEKAYIIFKLPALNRNVRNEIKKGKKIYFYDNGIRNAIINNFNLIENRTDTGALWENFIVSERLKYLNYNSIPFSHYFWRTTQQQEIDLIEEIGGKIFTYEIKWSSFKQTRLPLTFKNAYDVNEFRVITKKNYEEFLI